MRSRLKTNLKKQNTKAIFGIIIILLLIVLFGMKLLVGFTVVLEKFKNPKDNTVNTQSLDYIATPVINNSSTATNKANIDISGYVSSNNVSINLYVNSHLVDKTKPDSRNNFSFKDISLSPGDNEIKAKAISIDNKQSDFSDKVAIKYLDKPPALEINSPQDGQSFKKGQSPIKISGKTDSGVKVTVNDFWAISNDDGTFYYMFNLSDGDNNLKIVATDEAGNKTTKELKIKVE